MPTCGGLLAQPKPGQHHHDGRQSGQHVDDVLGFHGQQSASIGRCRSPSTRSSLARLPSPAPSGRAASRPRTSGTPGTRARTGRGAGRRDPGRRRAGRSRRAGRRTPAPSASPDPRRPRRSHPWRGPPGPRRTTSSRGQSLSRSLAGGHHHRTASSTSSVSRSMSRSVCLIMPLASAVSRSQPIARPVVLAEQHDRERRHLAGLASVTASNSSSRVPKPPGSTMKPCEYFTNIVLRAKK